MAGTVQNPDPPCPHPDFHADVEVGRIGEQDPGSGGVPTAYLAEITIACASCAEPFRFVGLAAGLSFQNPTASIDAQTLLAPVRPASAPDDFGHGIPGYTIKVVDP